MEKPVHIYALICPVSSEVKYIGKTTKAKERMYDHMNNSRGEGKKAWIESLKSKGLRPIMEILHSIEESEWEFWERHYISLYRSWGFKLYNKANGGKGAGGCSRKLTEEQKRKCSEWQKGVPKTEEFKRKVMSSGVYDRHRSRMNGASNPGKAQMKPVLQFDLNGNFIKEWDSIKNAEVEILGKRNSSITRCCSGKYKTACGYRWAIKPNGNVVQSKNI